MSNLVKHDGAAVAKELQAVAQQYLTFVLAGEMYAVGTISVKEIIEYGQLTTVPMMPSFIRGVINLRGAVVPVIDLGARFGGKQTEIHRRTCIVILEVIQDQDTQVIGVIVDAVSEVLEIPINDIEPPPAFGAKIRTDFIAGMGKVNGKFVILLNVGQVLSVDEMSTLAAIGTGSAIAEQ
ncbi:chemotaxis protein CheW [Leeia sp. TBRC 13508]|uniref:Chemotaxis protein CheW n=1 Tax=Leeia speluncae TaxID=2884804 RepID=A0ABS8D8J6_9NEIS|nr:chemotaxis protein CheW [Leeia speluncae]MCB6183963.1 chemotaxis protein CheW [Leeia speluncae]